jgi:nucleotide-binding universal stress UspA family protein
MKVVLSADNTAEGAAARQWCVDHIHAGDELIAVLGVDPLGQTMLSVSPLYDLTTETNLHDMVEREYCSPLRRGEVQCSARVLDAAQGQAVRQVARQVEADLIVVGKIAHGPLADFVLNETANHLVHRPPCPVVVVPVDGAHAVVGRSSAARQPSANGNGGR